MPVPKWYTSLYFKIDNGGQDVFFPWGYLGPGYLVHVDLSSRSIQAFLIGSVCVWGVVFLLMFVLMGSWLQGLLFAAGLLYQMLHVRWLMRRGDVDSMIHTWPHRRRILAWLILGTIAIVFLAGTAYNTLLFVTTS